MKDYWIITATFLVHFSLYYSAAFNDDNDYERSNVLFDQFRKRLEEQRQQDRREQIFHSREGSYHAFPPYDVRESDDEEDNDDRREFHGPSFEVAPYQRRVIWDERQHSYGTAPKDTEEDEIDDVPDLVRKSSDQRTDDDNDDDAKSLADVAAAASEKFKVETRADARTRKTPEPNSSSSRMEAASAPTSDMYFIALVAGTCAAAVFGVMAAGFCWYKFQKNAKAAAEAEYPAYGVTGPNKEHISPSSGGDRKLAQSAQMYHYQHQKQQMIAMEKNNGERQASTSDLDSEEENEEGDYTVYECPGLAPTGEMEVKNPLFQDEPTPASPPISGKPSLMSSGSVDSPK